MRILSQGGFTSQESSYTIDPGFFKRTLPLHEKRPVPPPLPPRPISRDFVEKGDI